MIPQIWDAISYFASVAKPICQREENSANWKGPPLFTAWYPSKGSFNLLVFWLFESAAAEFSKTNQLIWKPWEGVLMLNIKRIVLLLWTDMAIHKIISSTLVSLQALENMAGILGISSHILWPNSLYFDRKIVDIRNALCWSRILRVTGIYNMTFKPMTIFCTYWYEDNSLCNIWWTSSWTLATYTDRRRVRYLSDKLSKLGIVELGGCHTK